MLKYIAPSWLRDWKYKRHVKRCQKIFNHLYQGINGAAISRSERKRLGIDDYSLVYGEINFLSFAAILRFVQPQTREIFYDLGSGTGKAVIATALLYGIKKSCGVELLPSLAKVSKKITTKLLHSEQIKQIYPEKEFNIEFIQGDFLNVDFTEANIIFINATGFFAEAWGNIVAKFEQVKIGARIIVTSKQIKSECFQLLDARMRLMSWGMNSVYIYHKIK